MNTDEQPVASSATPESIAPSATPSLETLTGEQRATWRKTGSLPDAAAASSPATPEQALSTESSTPASEPGTPAKPAKKNAESRIQELLQERHARDTRIAELEARLNAPKEAPKEVPAAPEPMGEDFPEYEAWAETQPQNRRSYERYIGAMAVHVYQQQEEVKSQRTARATAEKTEAERLDTYRKNAEAFKAEHADYWQVIDPVTKTTMPVATRDALNEALGSGGYSPALLYHLGTHLEDFHRIVALPPAQAAYAIGKLDASLSLPAPPAFKTLSTAPDPPPTLRSKPATPVDDLEAAVKRGDFTSYKLAANRRTIAGR